MKHNKIDSDILDDNYFAEEEKKPSKIKKIIITFFKVIGLTILYSFLFLAVIIIFSLVLFPILVSRDDSNRNSEIYFIIFLSYIPFIYHTYRRVKNEKHSDPNWKIWVIIFVSIISTYISIVMFHVLNMRF